MKYSFLIIAISSAISSFAQTFYPDHVFVDYYRALEMKNENIENRINLFPSHIDQYKNDSLNWNIWGDQFPNPSSDKSITILPISWSGTYNTGYPKSNNDGAVWKGKGLNGQVQGGIKGKFGLVEFALAPVIFYSQNRPYILAKDTLDRHPLNYQFSPIDYVQRYGRDSYTHFDWGQSAIHLVYKSWTAGISTTNMTWGPAQVNPVLMSSNAAGIPRIEIGTHKPIKTKFGHIEGRAYWGRLRESKYFNNDPDDDIRYWSGVSLGYQPSFLPDLYLGVNRAFYKYMNDFNTDDLYITFWRYKDPNFDEPGNDEYDQMASITARYLFKEVGFETYIEYGKNDFGSGIVRPEPEHARGYTIGFSKYFDLIDDRLIKFTYEHASLDKARTGLTRPHNTWYTHSSVPHGYTNDGQVIGASVGPGSTTDYFGLQYFFAKGMCQINGQRIRYNDDYIYINEKIWDYKLLDHEWNIHAQYNRFFGEYLMGFQAGLNTRRQIHFVRHQHIKNWQFQVNITKSIGSIKNK